MSKHAWAVGVFVLVGCGGKVGGVDPIPSPGTEVPPASDAPEQDAVQRTTKDVPAPSEDPRKTMQAACSAAVIDVLDCATSAGYEVDTFRAQLHGDPEVNVIGIYESRSDHQGADYHPTGEASVRISRRAKQILVLSSYEPTHWTVTLDEGSNVQMIVTLGYYDQPVSFQGASVRVEHAGYACGYSYPYNGQGCDTNELFAKSEKASWSYVSAFAGCYRANTFVVRDDDEVCQ